MLYFIMICLLEQKSFANTLTKKPATVTRQISSTAEILNETDIKIFVENRYNEILAAKNNEKKQELFNQLYSTIQKQVDSYDKKLTELYQEIEALKERKEKSFTAKQKEAAEKQVFLDKWTEILVAFEKPANLFLFNQKSDTFNCKTIQNDISSSYLATAPAGSQLNEYAKKAIEIAKLLCNL